MLTLLRKRQPTYPSITVKVGYTIYFRRPEGGFNHWVRVEDLKIVNELAFIWFSNSYNLPDHCQVIAGMPPIFISEVLPSVRIWISDSKKPTEHAMRIKMEVPEDIEFWYDKPKT
jgi:hypothetical protein